MSDPVLVTATICGTAIFVTLAYFAFRLKLEGQQTFRKMLESSSDPDALIEKMTRQAGPKGDLRRGSIFFSLGLAMTLIFINVGGRAWIFGFIPMLIGLVYLIFWKWKTHD